MATSITFPKTIKSEADKAATVELLEYYKRHVRVLTTLPAIGISMWEVPGVGVPVQQVSNGHRVAYFSSYEVASSAVALCDRTVLTRLDAFL